MARGVAGLGCERAVIECSGNSRALTSNQFTGFAQKVLNPTHGSGWFIQMLSTRSLHRSVGIPPTVVGGLFKSLLRKDLKYPPIAMGGIKVQFRNISVERT